MATFDLEWEAGEDSALGLYSSEQISFNNDQSQPGLEARFSLGQCLLRGLW